MNGEQTMEDKIEYKSKTGHFWVGLRNGRGLSSEPQRLRHGKIAGIPARASQWKHLHGILRGEKP